MQEWYREQTGASLHRECNKTNFLTANITCLRNGSFQDFMLAAPIKAPPKDKQTGVHNYFCRLMQMRIQKEKHKKALPTMDLSRHLKWSLLWKRLQEHHVSMVLKSSESHSLLECHVIQ